MQNTKKNFQKNTTFKVNENTWQTQILLHFANYMYFIKNDSNLKTENVDWVLKTLLSNSNKTDYFMHVLEKNNLRINFTKKIQKY